MNQCTRPPEGWICRREEGHDGPCPTFPILGQQRMIDANLMHEEWAAESIGGGIAGTRAEVEAWVKEWRDEYGDEYEIYIQKRVVSNWKDAEL